MTPKLLKYSLPVLIVALPALAHAAFSVTDIRITRLDTNALLKDEDLKEFFNKAHCECGTKMDIEVRVSGYQDSSTEFQVVAGRNCLDPTEKSIEDDCLVLYGPVRANTLSGDFHVKSYKSATLTAKTLMADSCAEVDLQTYGVYVYVDKDGKEQWEELKKAEFTVDTKPPDAPKVDSGAVKAGENQASITFRSHTAETSTGDGGTSSSTKDPNFRGYQVLCAEKVTGAPGLKSGSAPKPEYEAAVNLCSTACNSLPKRTTTGSSDAGSSIFIPVPCAADGGPDAATKDAAAGKDAATTKDATTKDGPTDATTSPDSGSTTSDTALCAAFVCSEIQTSPGTITVKGLQNGVEYQFWVLTIDKANNPSTPQLAGSDIPQLVEDLWERYKRQGGKATGGCLVAPEPSPLDGAWLLGLAGVSLLMLVVVLVRRRRRRR